MDEEVDDEDEQYCKGQEVQDNNWGNEEDDYDATATESKYHDRQIWSTLMQKIMRA